jgi:hypothetical protein
MRADSSLAFVPLGAPLSLVAGAGVSVASAIIDLLGQGVGTPPANIIGNVTLFGEDVGVGDGLIVPKLAVATGVALATSSGATLNVQLQAAPDTAGTNQPGAWQTLAETGALTAAQCPANTVIARLDWPPVFPATLRPRYLRLNFNIPAAEDFTAGTIAYAIITTVRDDQANRQAAKNYAVA